MLIKLPEMLKRRSPLEGLHLGVVLFNEDPKKLGRIKVMIQGIWDEVPVNKLPWCYPVNPYGLGGDEDVSWFSVPEVGNEVVVWFPYLDPHLPYYIGYLQSTKTHQPDFDVNYPEMYGWVDSKGNKFIVDKQEDYILFKHHSGSYVKFLSDGTVEVKVTKDIKFDVDGDYNVKTVTATWNHK